SYFSDIGLAAALIQKKEPLTKEDLSTTFTLQQLLVLSATLIAFILTPVVANFYHLDSDGIFLYESLVISFFLSSLKTIPSILLERELRFDKLVIPQIFETIIFNGVALILAIKGFGVATFAFAVLARGISGLIIMYIVAPWKISFGISKQVAKKLLSFGIPFQANSMLALIKDDLLIAYIGKVLPLAQVGYIGFAQKWAFTPLRLIMDNVIRITFPSFARLQHKKDALVKGVEKSLFALSLLIFPSLTGLVILAPSFIHVIPKYHKWEPAILSLIFFAINAALSSISTPLMNAINAVGKIKMTLYFMIGWTIATWIITPFALSIFGYNGFAGASAVIATSIVIVVIAVKREINFSLMPILTPILATIVLGILLWFITHVFILNLPGILATILIGMLAYFAVVFLLAKNDLLADLAIIKKQFIK
ncbi:MAG: oligosaccharide flippase family protein, partial [Patescibacteria group bacterium]|nr:oligosaccharide flippase family protein [Patescibacteria group bacterium]